MSSLPTGRRGLPDHQKYVYFALVRDAADRLANQQRQVWYSSKSWLRPERADRPEVVNVGHAKSLAWLARKGFLTEVQVPNGPPVYALTAGWTNYVERARVWKPPSAKARR